MTNDSKGGALLPQRRASDMANRGGAAAQRIKLATAGMQRWAGQAHVRRWLPAIAAVAAVSVALAAALSLREPDRQTIFPGLAEADKARVVESLAASGYDVALDPATGAVQVPVDDVHRARMALAAEGLPEGTASGYQLLDNMPFGTSRAVERARLQQSQETELAKSIAEVSGVDTARVHIAVPEPSAFVRERSDPTASVFLRLQPGRAIDEGQVDSIVHLVASSVPGLPPANVAVVDQRGTLLSERADGVLGETSRQLGYRRKLERQWRDRVAAILVPLFGAENFSAEVALDLDFTASESTREVFDPGGSVLRSEQRSVREAGAENGPRGIPGALSNQPPAGARLEPVSNVTVAAGPEIPGGTSRDRDEDYVRNFEVGKEISVSRRSFGDVRRASVAVVIRQGDARIAPGKLAEVETLVAGAIGIDKSRGDTLVVRSQPFAAPPAESDLPVLERPAVQAWGGRLVALVLGIAALFLIGRPLAKIARSGAAPGGEAALAAGPDLPQPGTSDDDFDARLQLLRQLVASDARRASSAVSGLMNEKTREETVNG